MNNLNQRAKVSFQGTRDLAGSNEERKGETKVLEQLASRRDTEREENAEEHVATTTHQAKDREREVFLLTPVLRGSDCIHFKTFKRWSIKYRQGDILHADSWPLCSRSVSGQLWS